MSATHIVRVDLQARARVGIGVRRQEQVAVTLLGVGLLRLGMHYDLAGENPTGAPIEDAAVHLPAPAVRLGVVERGVIVDKAISIGVVKPVEGTMAASRVQRADDLVAYQAATHRQEVIHVAALGRHLHAQH